MTSRAGKGRHRVLVVEDEPTERQAVARLIAQWGYEVEAADTGASALGLIETYRPEVMVADLMLPDTDGLDLLQRSRLASPPPAVLIVTGHSSVDTAVAAIRQGAVDYLTKPADPARLRMLLEECVQQPRSTPDVRPARPQPTPNTRFASLVGGSPRMQEVCRWIELAASSSAPVLVYGESGTGKELVARTVHELSDRRGGPFIATNCAAIPESLIESELFGHERGAFTGATERRIGCFELAAGGTLLLDEIAEMDSSTQAKLLRVLQEGAFRRVGGATEVRVDVRVVAATNRVPMEAIHAGQLREDLFYRLNVFDVPLPPLRERREDIPLLAAAFIAEGNRRDGRTVQGLTSEAEHALMNHGWPGNVRELRNVIQLAVVLAGSGVITVDDLPPDIGGRASSTAAPVPTIRAMERELIVKALQATRHDKARAAAMLGISLKAFDSKLVRYGIKRSHRAKAA